MVYNVFAHTAKDGPTGLTKTPRPNDNEISIATLGHLYYVGTNTALTWFKMRLILHLEKCVIQVSLEVNVNEISCRPAKMLYIGCWESFQKINTITKLSSYVRFYKINLLMRALTGIKDFHNILNKSYCKKFTNAMFKSSIAEIFPIQFNHLLQLPNYCTIVMKLWYSDLQTGQIKKLNRVWILKMSNYIFGWYYMHKILYSEKMNHLIDNIIKTENVG